MFNKCRHGQGHVTPKFKCKLLFGKNSLGEDVYCYERLLVKFISLIYYYNNISLIDYFFLLDKLTLNIEESNESKTVSRFQVDLKHN